MSERVVPVTWAEVDAACIALLERHRSLQRERLKVWGIPSGGTIIAHRLGILDRNVRVMDAWEPGTLLVDDLVDSGATARRFIAQGSGEVASDACFRKPHSPLDLAPGAQEREGWLRFPWENSTGPEDAVVRLLEYVGEDPRRDGLKATPARVARSLLELTSGYKADVSHILQTTFDVQHDEMVVLKGVRFSSLCEHHLLPFTGEAKIGYLPGERVVGLSKLARLVDAYARRLQVQERLAQEIAHALMDHLKPKGAGVVLTAHHACMGCRGVRQPDAQMVTSYLLGSMRESAATRAEFLAL